MRVLLTGAAGQLGQALRRTLPSGVELIACSRQGGDGLISLDLADAAACRRLVLSHQPDWLINAGAYTAVDRAEQEPDLAMAVNALAPQAFAEALAESGGRLLQVSTDFVFNGTQSTPYGPEQRPDPLGVYGASKAAGEAAALAFPGARVLRTSWLYGPVGRNFCLTMLRLHRLKAAAGESLGVVADQVGCPTATATLAAACWRAVGADSTETTAGDAAPRILHCSDAGATSWYDFAMAIGTLGMAAGLLEQVAGVRPLTTADYPTPARRPRYSLLDCSTSWASLKLKPVPWQTALVQVLNEIRATNRKATAHALTPGQTNSADRR